MRAAYGSSWRAKHEDDKATSVTRKMPPLLRLNSTGEVSSSSERQVQGMGQQRAPRACERGGKSFLTKIASHLVPPTGGRSVHHLVNIHTTVGGITSLEEQLFNTKTMASCVTKKQIHTAGHHPSKMSPPFTSPARSQPSRYRQWTVDGLSPWMQPGVFPCHVFSAMQLGTPIHQISPSLWSRQSGVLSSLSDSVLNCQIRQFPQPVPYPFLPGQGRTAFNFCDKPSCSPSQKEKASAESGHCANTIRTKHHSHDSHCASSTKEVKVAAEAHPQGNQCPPCHQSDSNSVPCQHKTVDGCFCACKTAVKPVGSNSIIPNFCDSARAAPTSSSLCSDSEQEMASPLPQILLQNQSSKCETKVSLSLESMSDGSVHTEGEEASSADCQPETIMDKLVSDKGAAGLPSQSQDDSSFLDSDLEGSLHASLLSSSSQIDNPAMSSSSIELDTTDLGAASVGVEFDDISCRSDASTAASGQDTSQPSCSKSVSFTSSGSPVASSTIKNYVLPEDDLLTDSGDLDETSSAAADENDESDVDWDEEDEDSEVDLVDGDLMREFSFPNLSSFLPGQSAHSTPRGGAAGRAQCAAACCVVGKMMDAFEILFWGDDGEGSQTSDDIDGSQIDGDSMQGVSGKDVKNKGASTPCPAANARWNLHYPSEVPEKINAKVTFHCGEGVDQYHEIDSVEVEADPSTCEMTIMELQKLMDQRKKQPCCRRDSTDFEADDL